MALPFEVIVALRYLRSRRKAGISLTSFLTVLAFMTGVAALTIVTSVWNGFEAEFLDKLLGINAHAVILKRNMLFREHGEVAERLRKAPGVDHVAPFVYSEVIAQSDRGVQGLVIKGIDPDISIESPLADYVSKDPTTVKATLQRLTTSTAATDLALPGILIGKGLKETLHVDVGDVVTIISPYGSRAGRARTAEFQVAGVFHSGMFEFDARMAFIGLSEAQKFFRLYRTVTGLDVWTNDPMSSLATVVEATRNLDPEDPWAYEVKDWSITNRSVFGAVQQQKLLISLFLFLIVVVASCMIMATLILLILEKSREVAVLKALGAKALSIYFIFILDGIIIGVVGCLLGLAAGLGACAVLQQYGLRLDPRVYYLEHLPIVVRPSELAVVCAGALVLAIAAAAITSLMAAGLKPVDGLTQRVATRAAPRRRRSLRPSAEKS